MVQKKELKRESSIEFLRLFLMFLIIIHHSIVHGMGLIGLGHEDTLPMHFASWERPIATIVNCMCICAVNCFVLISGYFSIKLNLTKFLNILLTVLFYTFFLCSGYYLIEGNIKSAIGSMLIFSHPSYWFVNAYIYIMFFAPALNMIFDKMDCHYRHFFLVILIFISCYLGFIWHNPINPDGYNLFQFILMYSIGRFIHIQKFELKRFQALTVYLLSSILAGGLMFLLWDAGLPKWSWQMICYNNPLIIIAAIGLFLFFSSFKFKNKLINNWASSAFAVYLVQSSELCENYYYKFINLLHIEAGGGIWFIITILAIGIIMLSITIDQIQKHINKILTSKFCTLLHKYQINE